MQYKTHMASSSPISVSIQKQWYEIRDLFGDNNVVQNIANALALAATCEHPDAVWLTSICAGKQVADVHQLRQAFLEEEKENDPRCLFFIWRLGGKIHDRDWTRLRRSAELGYAFSQVCLLPKMRGIERFRLAQSAALKGERDAFYWLGFCFRDGDGCERDREAAKQNFLIAAELGHVDSMLSLGAVLGESDPMCWRWWGRAARLERGFYSCLPFVDMFSREVEKFNSSNTVGSAVVLEIGRVFKFSAYVREMVEKARRDEANQAVWFYDQFRQVVDTWSLVGIRLGVVKDVRIMIGKMIWKDFRPATGVVVKRSNRRVFLISSVAAVSVSLLGSLYCL